MIKYDTIRIFYLYIEYTIQELNYKETYPYWVSSDLLNCSALDGEGISDKWECQSAAAELGYGWSVSSYTGTYTENPTYPSGCFVWSSTGSVVWNGDSNEEPEYSSQITLICKIRGNHFLTNSASYNNILLVHFKISSKCISFLYQ